MDDHTTGRTLITIGGEGYVLADGEDVNGLKRRIETAVSAGGRFVDFAAEGRQMSVLVTTSSEIAMTKVSATRPLDVGFDPPGADLPDY
ncbi:hypothetical protein [Microbacterium sp. NPDC058345]|uniref:hypothetical protein n=1 Tax=Microbacterium sp. NPDC058345 TaxID=3346455 RepID=UPI00365DA6E4